MTTTYPASKQSIPTYAGTALQGDIDHKSWHDMVNDTTEAIEDALGTTAGTSVLKNMSAGDFVPTQATGAEVNTGTATLKYASPKAIADSYLGGATSNLQAQISALPSTRLESKIIGFTRDLTAVSGDVSYTGVGFKPTAVIFFGAVGGSFPVSLGFSDSTKAGISLFEYTNNPDWSYTAYAVEIATSAGNAQAGGIKSYDNDGFTITWTKAGSPTGTAQVYALCLK